MATYYLDGDIGNDSYNGLSATVGGGSVGPKLTLNGCLTVIAAAGAGSHTVYIKKSASAYGGSYYSLNSLADATTLTLQGYSSSPTEGDAADLGSSRPTISPTSTDWCFYRTSTWAGSSLILRNIILSPTSLAAYDLFRWGNTTDNGPDASLTAEYCSFILPSSCTAGILGMQTVNSLTSTRNVTLRNTTITAHSGAGRLFSLKEMGVFTLDHVTVINAGTATGTSGAHVIQTSTGPITGISITDCTFGTIGASMLYVAPTITTLNMTNITVENNTGTFGGSFFSYPGNAVDGSTFSIKNNTVTCNGYGIVVGFAYTDVARNGSWYNGVIRNNTIIRTGSNAGHALMLGINCSGTEVSHNVFYGLDGTQIDDFGSVIKAPYTDFHHNICYGRLALYICTGKHIHIHNNTVYGTKDGAVVWNVNTNPTYAAGTGSNAATSGSATVQVTGSNLSLIQVGDTLQIVNRTDGLNDTAFYEITAVDNTGGAQTMTVTPSPGSGSSQTWYAYAPRAKYLVISDNVIYGDGALCLYDLAGLHNNMRVDNNVYYSTGNLASVEGICADLAALKGKWGSGSWADSHLNDLNSVSGDPLFVDVDQRDYRVQLTSPAYDAASGTFWGAKGPEEIPTPEEIAAAVWSDSYSPVRTLT